MQLLNRRAITFLEIVIAVAILAVALIPLFGLMSRQTVETDKNASQAFAINKASEVLDTILDSVPFAALRQGNPGYIRTDDIAGIARFSRYNDNWARKLVPILFEGSQKESAGWPCRGIISDARGILDLVHLRVEDVISEKKPPRSEKLKIGSAFPEGKPADFGESAEMSFAFLRNPALLSDGNWIQEYSEDRNDSSKPFSELDLASGKGVAESPVNIYLDQGMEALAPDDPGFVDPIAERYTQKMVSGKVSYEASDKFAWCSMKKLLVQIQWNLDQKFFNNPETSEGRVQRIHLMTIKADID
jgi:hypothetical protein